MWKALLLKELRDTSLTLGVASVALALWLAEMTGWGFFTSIHNFDIRSPAPMPNANQWYVLFCRPRHRIGTPANAARINPADVAVPAPSAVDRRAIPLAKWGRGWPCGACWRWRRSCCIWCGRRAKGGTPARSCGNTRMAGGRRLRG